MIRYRNLYESEDAQIKLYDIVNYAGHDWYIVRLSGDEAVLLAKDPDFGVSKFGGAFCDGYYESRIRKVLNSKILPELQNNGANPLATLLPDRYCRDKVFLPYEKDVIDAPMQVRKFPQMWPILCDPFDDSITCIYPDGREDITSVTSECMIRPAIRVHIEELG